MAATLTMDSYRVSVPAPKQTTSHDVVIHDRGLNGRYALHPSGVWAVPSWVDHVAQWSATEQLSGAARSQLALALSMAIRCVPEHAPLPTVGTTSDGSIAIEWILRDGATAEIVIASDGAIEAFVASQDEEGTYGPLTAMIDEIAAIFVKALPVVA